MNRKTLAFAVLAVLFLQGAWVVYTQTAKPPGPLRIQKVKDDLFMISGEGGNVAVYATSEGVVLVDDMLPLGAAICVGCAACCWFVVSRVVGLTGAITLLVR